MNGQERLALFLSESICIFVHCDFGRNRMIIHWQPAQHTTWRIAKTIVELVSLPTDTTWAVHCVAVFDDFTVLQQVQGDISKEVVHLIEIVRL